MGGNMGLDSCLFIVFSSFLLFNVLNKLVFVVFPPPEKFRQQVQKSWLWRNISVSWVHSLVTAVLSAYSLCTKPEMLEDMINTWTNLSYYALALSTGYFLYDLVNVINNDWERSFCIAVHHVIVISAFLICLFNEKYIPFGLVALLMEINSVFLHSRRLMRMSDISPVTLPYKINGILLTITFVIFRLLACGWMLNYLIMNRHVLPISHFTFATCGMCVLMPQNIVLLKQVFVSDSKSKNGSRQKELEAEKELNGAVNSLTKFKQFLHIMSTDCSE